MTSYTLESHTPPTRLVVVTKFEEAVFERYSNRTADEPEPVPPDLSFKR